MLRKDRALVAKLFVIPLLVLAVFVAYSNVIYPIFDYFSLPSGISNILFRISYVSDEWLLSALSLIFAYYLFKIIFRIAEEGTKFFTQKDPPK